MIRLTEMISRNLFLDDRKKKLRIWDFDDTLVRTDSYVYVTNEKSNKTRKLTPGEYAVYKPKKGDVFDYSDFQNVKNPTEIREMTKVLKRVVRKSRGTVYILTARAAYRPIRKYLKDIGIDISKIYVVALASGNPQDKADWIEDMVDNKGYNDVYFADDSIKNVKAVKKMLQTKDLMRWRVQHVKY